MRVGFVGTGSMGTPIARNLLSAEHDLFVHDRRRGAAHRVVRAGATWCTSPAEVAADVDVVLLSLPSHAEVEAVCFGQAGLFSTIRPGTYLIDLSTGSIDLIPRLAHAQRTLGIRYLTSPVSQGVDSAASRRLTVFVGGERRDYQDCRSIYGSFARTVIYTGDHVSAMAATLLTNLLWYVTAAALGEALVLGAKAGIDLPVLQQVVLNSCGTSWAAEHDIPSIYDGSYDPTFTTRLCTKDLRLIGELAAAYSVPLEVGSLVEQIFRRAQNLYGGASPQLSVVRYLQDITGTDLHTKATGPAWSAGPR